MRTVISLANNHTKGKRLDAEMTDRIDGGRLSRRAARLVRKTKLRKKANKHLAHKLDSQRGDLTPEDGADSALIQLHEDGPDVDAKVISESGDVIYSPSTQSTQYSARRAVKSNLERRIPGSLVKVHDISGDGLVRLSLSLEYDVAGTNVQLQALSLASPSDMTIISAEITCNEKLYDIDPVDQARTPEETAIFLTRLAANCASM